jgi:Beta/Gamma crystallin
LTSKPQLSGVAATAAAATTTTTTTTTSAPGHCNITLYSQTYLRGESFSTLDNVSDLSIASINFDKKATSAYIAGWCCWTLFTLKEFGGVSKMFYSGSYQSAVDLGMVFRNVSSIKRC